MPLFICNGCGCVENTALSNYWLTKLPISIHHGKPAVCTACDPVPATGEKTAGWHGRFPRAPYRPETHGHVLNPPSWAADWNEHVYSCGPCGRRCFCKRGQQLLDAILLHPQTEEQREAFFTDLGRPPGE